MGNNELLTALYALRDKIAQRDSIKDVVEDLEEELRLTESILESEKKLIPERMPVIAPDVGAYSGECSNLKNYDKEHEPKSKFKLVVYGIIGAVVLAGGATLIGMLPGAFLTDGLDVGDIILFIISMGVAAFIMGYPLAILYALLEPAMDKIVNYRNESLTKKFMRKHQRERQAVYQKDLDVNQAQIDESHARIRGYNEELPDISTKLNIAKQQLAIAAGAVKSDISLPAGYKNLDAVCTIIVYLENWRAESLKEAINLYEKNKKEDAHNKVMEEAAQASASHARRQAQAAREMANAQNLAAFEAQRQRIAAQEAAESAKKAAEANQEALDILKDWERKSN